jgi:hypothetical protein
MVKRNAIGEGFRAAWRNPALMLAELAWRWVFGAAALVLIAIGIREVELAVTISPMDELLLRSMQPVLISEALAHILKDTLPLLAKMAAILLPAVTAMWIVAATVGRMAVTRGLLEYFATEYGLPTAETRGRWGAITALNAFRAAIGLAVALGYVGAAVVASRFASTTPDGVPRVEGALLVFVLIFAVVVVVAAAINWLLALAPVFVVRDGAGTFQALADSARMFRTRGSQFTSAATMNGFIRAAVAIAISVAGLFPLAMIEVAPKSVVVGLLVVLTLVYFLISDWLLLSRLGAYVAVVERARAENMAAPEVS